LHPELPPLVAPGGDRWQSGRPWIIVQAKPVGHVLVAHSAVQYDPALSLRQMSVGQVAGLPHAPPSGTRWQISWPWIISQLYPVGQAAAAEHSREQ
jgi:hypothetical protein